MTTFKTLHAVLGVALAFAALTACGDSGGDDTSTTTPDPSTTTPDPTTTMPDPDTTMDPPDPDTTMDPPDPTTTTPDPTTTMPDPTTGPDPTGDDEYNFAEDPYDAYEQIDRHAAVEAGTAGIAASAGLGLMGEDISIRSEYNKSNPVEDADMMWLGEIADSIMFFHGALDDDISGLGFDPATFDQTVAQAGPVIIPDTIKYDPGMPTGYPNGRTLTDPVVDITLAAVLLDLGTHPLTAFVDLPLNPPANDKAFKAEFPFLADPNL